MTAFNTELAQFRAFIAANSNTNTGQAGQAEFTFATINLKVSAIERVVVLDSAGQVPVSVNIVDPSLNDGDNNSVVTFTFLGPVTGFDSADVTAMNGTLTDFVKIDASHYTAKFIANDGFAGTGSVSVTANSYTDLAGNLGAAGSDTVIVDTANPTVVIGTDDSALKIGDVAHLTFTLSEASTSFGSDDVAVAGGTLSNFAGSGTSYTADFTPTPGSTTTATVNVAGGGFTDAAGNNNTAATQLSMTVDTVAPTVVIGTDDSALKIGDVAHLTFTLSEAS
ncbi:Ig-like domain-containing protein, partial [Mesorhizobium sp. M0999]